MCAAVMLASLLLAQERAEAQKDNAENIRRLRTWRLADIVSQDTLGYALGADKDRLAQLRNDASGLARALDVPLADLPKWKGIPKEDAPLAVQYLLTGSPAEQLRTKYGHEYQATYDLATMVNLAMLLYSPGSEQQTKSISTFMERAGQGSKIPEDFWKDAVAKIRKREASDDVDKALRATRQAIGRYLEQQAEVESPVKLGSPNSDEGRPRLTKEERKGNYRMWRFGQVLGVAAISNSGGKKPEVVEVLMKEANRLAKEIGVEVLELPERQNDEVKDGLVAMSYLIKTVGVPVRKLATRQYGPGSARLYDLAIYSSLLSTLYGPEIDAEHLQPIRKLIEDSARESRLPEALVKPLLKKVDDKAAGPAVRQAIVDMQAGVSDFLEKESNRD